MRIEGRITVRHFDPGRRVYEVAARPFVICLHILHIHPLICSLSPGV